MHARRSWGPASLSAPLLIPLAWVLVSLAAASLSTGCSSGDPLGRYREMDGESKVVFLNLYPELTPSQRNSLLTGSSYLDPLRELKLNPDVFFKDRARRSPVRLEVVPQDLTDSGVELRAWLHYRDGRKVDVTRESTWVVFPKLVSLQGGSPVKASWGCMSSDAVVNASFFGELEGKTTLRPRKRVRELIVTLDESSQSVESVGSRTRLKAVAHCEDGTSQDVSCQADWKLLPDPDFNSPREIGGCGLYHQLDVRAERAQTEALRTERIVVDVQYSNAHSRTTLQLPRRK